MTIDISKKDKAQVLKALYDASSPKGLGRYAYIAKPLPIKDARHLLTLTQQFDTVDGRALKIDLSTNQLDVTRYDEINGVDAAAKALATLPDVTK